MHHHPRSRERLTILVRKRDDPSAKIFVFFPAEPQLNTKHVETFLNRMKSEVRPRLT